MIAPRLFSDSATRRAASSERLNREGIFSKLDIHFAFLMTRLSGEYDQNLFLASALVSRSAQEGNICLDLTEFSGKRLLEAEGSEPPVICPELVEWTDSLMQRRVVGREESACPMILDLKNRLYLRRFWEYEKNLADSILKRTGVKRSGIDESRIRALLNLLFPESGNANPDLQALAVLSAFLTSFCVISGG
ncbi:MAG: hypothetical protein AB1659_10500, partial [Thermodesulfobacteriota bacterium]